MLSATRGLSCFFASLFGLSTIGYAEGRFAIAPLSDRDNVRAWVAQNSERYWLEGEDRILVHQADTDNDPLPGKPSTLDPHLYFLYGAAHLPEGSKEIMRGGRVRVIASPKPLALGRMEHGALSPIKTNHELSRRLSVPKGLKRTEQTPAMDALQWHTDLQALSGFSRYSYGSGIDEAKDWLVGEFQKIWGVDVKEHAFDLPFGRGVNVMATIKGRSRPDEIYIVGAHYDSISEKPMELAPGSEDNASGAAGLLSLARAFAANPPEATIVFAAFSGEEEGLYGSTAWVEEMLADGSASRIKAAFIMDMIGYSGDKELDCLLETSSITKDLLATIESANDDEELVLSQSLDYWGSDHEPFLDRGLPAILFIENDYLNYPNYHRSTDTPDKIHPTLGPKVLKLIRDSLTRLVY